jgi:catechol 2,3-dioxygenase-like lactoylglutathione lyase family enzyme
MAGAASHLMDILLFPVSAFRLAPGAPLPRVMTMGFRMDTVGVVVADLPKSIAFYGRLGCTFEGDLSSGRMTTDLGGLRFSLITEELLRTLGWDVDQDAPRTGTTLGVCCDTAAEVDELYTWLDEDGFGFRAPMDAPWGQRLATVQDPDGSHIDLYAPRP